MKTLRLLIPLLAILTTATPLANAENGLKSGDPRSVAESFFAGYVAQVEADSDTRTWVAASKLVTAKFKTAYAKAMSAELVEADPVLQAQDVPQKPFKAAKTTLRGDSATVVLSTRFEAGNHEVTTTLVRVKGVWLLDSVK